MKLYIASHSQGRARAMRAALPNYQHVARWIDAPGFGQDKPDEERRRWAVLDVADVVEADALILLAEAPGVMVPGGKHVETGVAIALGRPVIVVGRRENIFHWHPLVRVVASESEVAVALQEIAGGA